MSLTNINDDYRLYCNVMLCILLVVLNNCNILHEINVNYFATEQKTLLKPSYCYFLLYMYYFTFELLMQDFVERLFAIVKK